MSWVRLIVQFVCSSPSGVCTLDGKRVLGRSNSSFLTAKKTKRKIHLKFQWDENSFIQFCHCINRMCTYTHNQNLRKHTTYTRVSCPTIYMKNLYPAPHFLSLSFIFYFSSSFLWFYSFVCDSFVIYLHHFH